MKREDNTISLPSLKGTGMNSSKGAGVTFSDMVNTQSRNKINKVTY